MGIITTVPEALLTKAGVKNPKLVMSGIMIVGGIVITIVIIHQVRKFLGKTTEKVDKHPVSGVKSLTSDDAKSIADRLWGNLNGNMISSFDSVMTDIPDQAKLTEADKQMIYNAFGIRNNGFPFYTKGDLYFWLDRKIKFGIASAKEYWGY